VVWFLHWSSRPNWAIGIVLIVSGIALLIGGIAGWSYCGTYLLGVCVAYPDQGVGLALMTMGIALGIVGIVFVRPKRSSGQPPPR